MISISVADYTQFLRLAHRLSKAEVVFTVDETFSAVVFAGNVAAVIKQDAKPARFDKDFPEAVQVAGIAWG